jgi:hypothetical protein
LAAGPRLRFRDCISAILATGAGALLINAPQYARNYELSGSVLGYDSAHADGFFRWRNETLGWKPAVSNILRNTSEQLGARSDSWNRRIYQTVVNLHLLLGLDPQDPGATWRWSNFGPPRNSNHEADANNRWHLLILVVALIVALYAAGAQGERRWLCYALGPAGGFFAFCFYLKWQPYFSRLEAPLFVISAPLAAMAMARIRPAVLQAAVCLLLLSNARLALMQNWTRPLTGPVNLRNTPRPLAYFNDMAQWNNRASYLEAVNLTAASGCNLVGVDLERNHLEYPFQALLRERNPSVRFMHVSVGNPSARYALPDAQPCAVLCLDCAGMEAKIEEHGPGRKVHEIGRFLLFTNR